MSRSYKKIPCLKDHNKGMKKYANRYVRRNYLVVPSGSAYKKLFCSYDICDFKFFETFDSYKKSRKKWMSEKTYSGRMYSDKELYRRWYTEYKMK